MIVRNFILIFINGFLWTNFCNCLIEGDDLHSSVTALNGIFKVEKLLIGNLANYIIEAEENINFFKRNLNTFEYNQRTANQNGFVRSIVKLFLFKRRLSLNLPIFQDHLNLIRTKVIQNFTKIVTEHDYPDVKDLDGAVFGILRVQEVYDISAEQIANGDINGIDSHTRLTACDCFGIAVKLSSSRIYYYAADWYKITLKRIEEEGWKGILPEVEKIAIVSLLINSQYQEGDLNSARDGMEISLKALKENYNNNNYGLYFSTELKRFTEHYIAVKSGTKKLTPVIAPLGALNRHNLTELNYLKRACRSELRKSAAEQRELFCKYEKENHPFLLIAPIKVEILNLSPYLIIFHDILYDSEIETLKKLSTDKLVRAQVWNHITGKGEPSLVRTSKYVWFENETHPLIHTLNQRVSDMTGLTMETAEDFQLMNYGTGGHYDIHADYLSGLSANKKPESYLQHELGDRIATVLFYLSDVSLGGATVWPYINVIAFPRKGTAAFWYNLKRNGRPYYESRHSACPVIAGSKWVINKWIRATGQIFRRPCHTSPD